MRCRWRDEWDAAPDITRFSCLLQGRHVSGTWVRQIAALGGDVSAFAPAVSVAALKRAIKRRGNT
jgi:pantetheine-phosphate adenylyltransferase